MDEYFAIVAEDSYVEQGYTVRIARTDAMFCVLNALVPGVILGIAIPFLINLSVRKAFPVLYHIPWAALFGGIFVLIGIVFFITRTEIHKLRDKSIIDEIRKETKDLILAFTIGEMNEITCHRYTKRNNRQQTF